MVAASVIRNILIYARPSIGHVRGGVVDQKSLGLQENRLVLLILPKASSLFLFSTTCEHTGLFCPVRPFPDCIPYQCRLFQVCPSRLTTFVKTNCPKTAGEINSDMSTRSPVSTYVKRLTLSSLESRECCHNLSYHMIQ